jgi:signal transduction histidine kinase
MSVSVGHRRARTRHRSRPEPPTARVFLWMTSALTVALALPGGSRLLENRTQILWLAIWAAVVAAVDLLPIRVWKSVSVSMSFPVTLAAGMLFLPTEAALVCFLGSFDPRELKGEVSLAKSIFNRSQVAISVMAGSALFHAMGGSALAWPAVLFPGLGALLLDAATNAILVVMAISIQDRMAPPGVVAKMFGASPLHYLAGYLLLGLLSMPLAAAVAVGGVWALLLFLAPLVLAREMFRQTQQLLAASERIREKDAAILESSEDVMRERKDERLRLAGELHDEVLPSLFKVHLMGQVLKQDLAGGRLLELDEDLPELLTATDVAQRTIRDLLGELRRSPIGAGGLIPTVRMLVDQLEVAGAPPISIEMEPVKASPLSQLLAYQLIREALYNSAKHAAATRITVRLVSSEGLVRLVVSDDGVGFDQESVDRERHFGLQLMMERLEAAGGRMTIDSRLGEGTIVAASLPVHL